jgi:hypothetical protein
MAVPLEIGFNLPGITHYGRGDILPTSASDDVGKVWVVCRQLLERAREAPSEKPAPTVG